ncbi:MAG: AMP-binding protein [Acholeplasmatales bacterium]|nr:AMP-binding protein [Acholeplasmatales bacterium]
MINIKKIVNTRVNHLVNSNKDFEAIYNGMFLNPEYIFAETNDGHNITKYTFKQVDERINDIAYSLNKNYPLLKDQYIGIAEDNSIEWIYIFFGILKSGNKPFLINLRHPKSFADSLIRSLNVGYTIGTKDLEYDAKFISLDSLNLKCEANYKFTFGNEMALSTSATTMKEKIVFYNGQEISNQILNVEEVLKNNKQVKKHYKGYLKQLVFLPLYHIFGFMATFIWFSYFGRCMVFLNDYSSDSILNTIKLHKVTHIFAVPIFWNTIERKILAEIKNQDEKTRQKFEKGQKLSIKLQRRFPNKGIRYANKLMKQVNSKLFGDSVLFCISGGSYIKDSTLYLINSLGYPLYNGYGMSEIGITSVTLGGIDDRLNNNIGHNFSSVEYKIENNGLYVRGKSLSHKMMIDGVTYNFKDDEWFDTCDLVHEKDGKYYIDGRRDDLFIGINGENVNPDVIEREFDLNNVNNLSILDINNNLSLVIEISDTTPENVLESIYNEANELNNKLDMSCRISKIYFTYDMIKNPNSIKVSRQYLKAKIKENKVKLKTFEQINNVKTGEVDQKILLAVKELMAETLGIKVEDINDTSDFFFDLNGTSLDYFDLVSSLVEKFDINVDYEDNAIHTPIEIAREIERILSL